MAKKREADVLVVTHHHAVTGGRRSGKGKALPGGVRIVSNTAGPENLPTDITIGAIHVDDRVLTDLNQRIWFAELLEGMGRA